MGSVDNAGEKWYVAGGPDEWSMRRLELWQKGNLFDLEVKCSGDLVVKASKIDLAVYSGYFKTFFNSQFPDASKQEVNIEGADPNSLECIVRALYEKEILITFENAASLIALSDRLQISCIIQTVEQFLISHLSYTSAVESLTLAGKYNCKRLREAALAATICNFDRIPLDDFAVLSFTDYHEIITSSQLPVEQESILYHSTKLWADALERQNSCHEPSDSEDKLLLLFGHIQWRLCTPNDMKLIFADPWLVMRTNLLSAIAIHYTSTLPTIPRILKNRTGKVIRFSDWSLHLERAKSKNGRVNNVSSGKFSFPVEEPGQAVWEVVLYPYGRHDPMNNIAIYLGAPSNQAQARMKFSFIIVNQRNPEKSLILEKADRVQPNDWYWWGNNAVGSSSQITTDFVLEDTLMIYIVPTGD